MTFENVRQKHIHGGPKTIDRFDTAIFLQKLSLQYDY